VVLCLLALTLALPLVWLISTSLKTGSQTFLMPPKWIPDPFVWSNYAEAFRAVAFHEYFWNTIRIVFFATTGALLTASLAAYAFARLRFPLREPLFLLVLSTIMLPSIVTLIPTFIVFRTLGWIDTLLPLIVPLWFGGGAFNIFLFRQFFMTIPLELDEAARIDGASNFRIYCGVILPLSKPVLATIAVFAFIHNWNDFFEPLIYLQSPENWTMAIGLRGFRGLYSTEWNLMMAASTAMILPLLILFFFAQRYFVSGIQMSGLAGK
jgi:multiple sugar transport system permease protein